LYIAVAGLTRESATTAAAAALMIEEDIIGELLEGSRRKVASEIQCKNCCTGRVKINKSDAGTLSQLGGRLLLLFWGKSVPHYWPTPNPSISSGRASENERAKLMSMPSRQ